MIHVGPISCIYAFFKVEHHEDCKLKTKFVFTRGKNSALSCIDMHLFQGQYCFHIIMSMHTHVLRLVKAGNFPG